MDKEKFDKALAELKKATQAVIEATLPAPAPEPAPEPAPDLNKIDPSEMTREQLLEIAMSQLNGKQATNNASEGE